MQQREKRASSKRHQGMKFIEYAFLNSLFFQFRKHLKDVFCGLTSSSSVMVCCSKNFVSSEHHCPHLEEEPKEKETCGRRFSTFSHIGEEIKLILEIGLGWQDCFIWIQEKPLKKQHFVEEL